MAEIQRKGAKKQSEGQKVWDAVLTGVSYMIPFIVAKAMGGYNIGADMAKLTYDQYTPAMTIYAIGSAIFNVCVPIIGAYIAYALADKPGLAPGFAVGDLKHDQGRFSRGCRWWYSGRLCCDLAQGLL